MPAGWLIIRKEQLDETLAQEPVQGKKSLEPLRALAVQHHIPLHIVEDHSVLDNRAEVHLHEADFWICLEGEATFLLGGLLIDPAKHPTVPGEWSGPSIEDGEEHILRPGDMLWIPPGVPHVHSCASTTRLLILKVRQ